MNMADDYCAYIPKLAFYVIFVCGPAAKHVSMYH